MKGKQFWTMAAVVGVVFFLLEFLLHAVALDALYDRVAAMGGWRTDEQEAGLFPFHIVGSLLFGLMFAFIYIKGYEARGGVAEGLRYAIYVWLLRYLAETLTLYPVYDWPAQVFLWQAVGGLVEMLVLGAIVGVMWKGAPKPAPQAV